jgi:hypothetical protein
VHLGGVAHVIEKLLMKTTTLYKTHFKQRSKQQVMGFQSDENPNFGTFDLGVLGKMTFGCSPCG